MTNADDIILTPANLAFLRRTFGDRARIYPHGGHGGNLSYHENAADIVQFFHARAREGAVVRRALARSWLAIRRRR